MNLLKIVDGLHGLGEAPNLNATNLLPVIDMRRRKRRAYCKMTPQDKVEVLLKRLRRLERKSP